MIKGQILKKMFIGELRDIESLLSKKMHAIHEETGMHDPQPMYIKYYERMSRIRDTVRLEWNGRYKRRDKGET